MPAAPLPRNAPQDGEDFLSVGEDEPGPVEAFLLAIDPEDAESYWRPYRSLIHGLTQSGAPVLHRLVEERFGAGAAERLLAGLDPLPLPSKEVVYYGRLADPR